MFDSCIVASVSVTVCLAVVLTALSFCAYETRIELQKNHEWLTSVGCVNVTHCCLVGIRLLLEMGELLVYIYK
jgi:hypothetical protein